MSPAGGWVNASVDGAIDLPRDENSHSVTVNVKWYTGVRHDCASLATPDPTRAEFSNGKATRYCQTTPQEAVAVTPFMLQARIHTRCPSSEAYSPTVEKFYIGILRLELEMSRRPRSDVHDWKSLLDLCDRYPGIRVIVRTATESCYVGVKANTL